MSSSGSFKIFLIMNKKTWELNWRELIRNRNLFPVARLV